MAQTLTSTAYLEEPKEIVAGVNSVSFDYTATVSLSASANANVILGPKIPNGSTILQISGSHSSGAATMPMSIGYDDSLSAFASDKTQGTNAITTKTSLPFKVSVSDDAANLFRVLKFSPVPGTETANAVFNYTVMFTRDA